MHESDKVKGMELFVKLAVIAESGMKAAEVGNVREMSEMTSQALDICDRLDAMGLWTVDVSETRREG